MERAVRAVILGVIAAVVTGVAHEAWATQIGSSGMIMHLGGLALGGLAAASLYGLSEIEGMKFNVSQNLALVIGLGLTALHSAYIEIPALQVVSMLNYVALLSGVGTFAVVAFEDELMG